MSNHLPVSRRGQRLALTETMLEIRETELQQLVESSVSESTGRLELALEDVGWQRLVARSQTEFSRSGIERISQLCRIMWRKNPLIKRAINVRGYYTWAQGVSIQAADDTVNDLVQQLTTDRRNRQAWYGSKQRLIADRTLHTDGQLAVVLVTSRVTGAVQVRTIPWTQLVDYDADPDDRLNVRFWLRRWHEGGQDHKQWHPDVDAWVPAGIRPSHIDGVPIVWDQPIMHVAVDRYADERWGVPEAYAAIDWAKAYKEFLEDWSSYVRALAEFAWKHKTKSGAAARRAKSTHQTSRTDTDGNTRPAGSTAVGTDVDGLEPIKHQGAHVDATSGRPLAVMVAAAFDMPYSILTGDADNSNLATAKTLDRPFELALTTRQQMWSDIDRRIIDHAIDAAAVAVKGPLQGRAKLDEWGRPEVDTGELDRTVNIEFPPLVEHELKELVEAITKADATGKVPAEVTARQLLNALGVEDVDAHVKDVMKAAEQAGSEEQAQEAALHVMAEALRKIAA